MDEVSLTEDHLRLMKRAKVFKAHEKRVNCIDFSHDGNFMISSGDDETLQLYNCLEGRLHKTIPSKKYGCGFVRFTHHHSAVIYASKNQFDDSIRYLSVHDNRYLRYFKGHRHRVCCLAMSPLDDMFISAAKDDSVRVWDVRSPKCAGLLRTKGTPRVAFDPEGVCFGVAYTEAKTRNHMIKLFDIRRFDEGPFASFTFPMAASEPQGDVTHFKFSPDSKTILLAYQDARIALYDAFDGTKLRELGGHSNEAQADLEASFSPDGRFVCSGSDDGKLFLWETDSGRVVKELEGHAFSVGCVAFNPKLLQLGSACQNVVFWLPAQVP
eukprot:CAMPEP_0198728264 /NCGR_PEP_ID=MMETSP1475-20131203/8257_1 /TAXON_ID= ORGANISM="Unidentified sp., Strain CCMP1999" /NCGR_SAMPLE_ID=MMETSP1475 /ASSEMBLY_ACC=CAM_ASM_001111 /LENGTH=324 /DNA_ID=CAMNT_0044490577 /DNA_START=6 /DNA_END=980 /DNA_ORIENTATION=-